MTISPGASAASPASTCAGSLELLIEELLGAAAAEMTWPIIDTAVLAAPTISEATR